MMGAEPLEVPHQSNNSQNQNNNNSKSVDSTYQGTNEGQQNSLLIPSSTSIEEGCWEVTLQTQHNTRSNSNNSNGGQSSSTNSTSNSNSKGPRRTRHRVDAGEPRGCFNSANNPSFAFQPRNIFTSPQHNNSIGPLGSNSNLNSVRSPLNSNSLLSPYHPHHPHHQVQQHLAGFTSPLHNISHNFFGGSGGAQLPPQGQGQGQDAYYFQPMKMLSEFITSQQAAAAAAAAATGISQGTGPSTPTTTNAGSGVVNGQTQHQLLLREMLSKSRNNNNNNNVVTKCGYEDEVVLDNEKSVLIGGEIVKEVGGDDDENNSGGILGADESEEDEEIKLVKIENSLGTEGSKSGLGSAGGHSNSNGHLNNVNNTNVNANSTSSSVTSNCSTGGNSGMRINGCKKRKLYQPQQRSDFEEVDDEEEVDEEDYDSNVLVEAAAMARSGRLNTKDSSSPPPSRSSPLTSGQLQGQVVQPQLPIEEDLEDEEEEMQRMLIKTDRTDYDDDQFDDEEDEDDLSNTNNNNNNNNKEDLRVHSSSATAAPLTRQLLTERNVSKEGRKGTGNSLSLLRTSSSSPKLMLHSSGLNHLRRREHHHNNISQSEENHFMHQRESILPVGANPAAYFYQWKENFKSTLISHITDLVDNQFSLLFPSGTNPNNNNNNNNNNVNSNRTSSTPSSVQTPPNQHNGPRESPIRTVDKLSRGENQHQNQNQQQEKVLPQQHKNPASLLLNGGTVCNNNNREMCSPPPEKIPRLDLNQGRGNNNNKNEYFPRFPFGVSGNIPNQGGRGDQGQIQREREQQIKTHQQHQQNFSSALMGLSQAAQLQHHQAAAAAAAALNAAEMFENDGPLSLVVSRQHDQMTPRKKRHKVTDTRLTPRAVSRLLGQVDNYGGDLSGGSPSRGDVPRTPPPGNGPPSLPTSVAIANPSLSDSARLFTPYAHPLFGHHGGIQPGGNHHRLGSSPPMGASLIHPALLANPAEYVQQLRAEMQNEQNQRNGDLLRGEGGRGDHVRAVRDSGSSLISGRPGSAGSDSGETNSFGGDLPGSMYSCSGTSHSSSSTLTPMHLRKAKLMFFWVRYPSSSVIKMYFPDIKFNKNNTAQLVKWFSNFREFYYIQMEKYARQALSEGIKNAEELHVTIDNELYRVLNLHYNRNNHIEVPTNFRFVVEQTLREFFKAIQQGKDQEQSWKKAIYKIIARLDDPVPEYFKSPNFLEQLE